MPTLDKLLDQVRAALPTAARVEEKQMFGGRVFMVNGKMCIGVHEDRLMFRIDPEVHDRVLPRKGCETMMMKGRSYRGYVKVSVDVLRLKKEFDYWAGLALEFNSRAKSAGKRKKKGA